MMSQHHRKAFSIIAFISLATLCYALDANAFLTDKDDVYYSNKLVLAPYYNLSWRVDLHRDEIFIKIEAKTTGWVGLGISEPASGSMPGSDIVVAWVNGSTQQTFVTDRFAVAFAEPILDTCQDWHLVAGKERNGVTTVHLRRKLNLTSSEDRPIPPGPVRIVFAIGSTDKLSYHGPNRTSTIVQFYGDVLPLPPLPDADLATAEFHMNASVPSKTTTYMCKSFSLPGNITDGSILKFEPIFSHSEFHLPHHLVVYGCHNTLNTSYAKLFKDKAEECISPLGVLESECGTVIFGWAVGSGSLLMPDNVGFRIGNSVSYAFTDIVMEVHYNNPTHVTGVVDNAGLIVTYTPHKRPIDAGTMIVGDSIVGLPPIPARQPAYAVETTCPSECTSTWQHDINVFADFLHMHQAGSRMFTNQFLSDGSSRTNNRVDWFDFGFQQIRPVQYKVSRGDRLNIHCIYNTSSRSNVTRFFLESTDEMCLDFLFYWPVTLTPDNTPSSLCGYVSFGEETGFFNGTVCGDNNFEKSIIPVFNPTVIDPVENYPRTFGFFIPNGTVCSNAPQTPVPQPIMFVLVGTVSLMLAFFR